MAKGKRRSARSKLSLVGSFECSVCMSQMMGELPNGERCWTHNPTPEEREAHPELYARGKFAGLADLKQDIKEQQEVTA